MALYLDTLGVAYSEAGRFNEAVQAAQVALELAKGTGSGEQVRQIQERVKLYQAGRPYREETAARR